MSPGLSTNPLNHLVKLLLLLLFPFTQENSGLERKVKYLDQGHLPRKWPSQLLDWSPFGVTKSVLLTTVPERCN